MEGRKLRIAIVVHGRFHAFDIARELLKRGHEVTVLSNYPVFVVERFGVPAAHVRTNVWHGIASRLAYRWRPLYPEAFLHRWFGRWAAAKLRSAAWDVVLCWSGVAEETLQQFRDFPTLRVCQRSSSHIRTQARLLEEEEQRTGAKLDRPSQWMIAREEREYELADIVLANSSFVQRTLIEQGVPQHKVETVVGAVDVSAFRPQPDVIDARRQRLLAGEQIRVLNVGTFSFRKGMWDMTAIIEQLSSELFTFRFVGPIAPESKVLAAKLAPHAEFVPKQSQSELPFYYGWADVFVLPTIEDGYPTVLAQAAAAGLPVLTTTNSGADDLVRDGESGWILPIRSPQAFIEKLQWCHTHRTELARMVENVYTQLQPRDWADAARDFEQICYKRLPKHENALSSGTFG